MATAWTFVLSPEHVYPEHPEQPERFRLIEAQAAKFEGLERLKVTPARRHEVSNVHSARMIAELEEACRHAPGIIDFAPTFVTSTSFKDALNAAGGTLVCTRAVLDGEARNAFAVVRPPGHHAEPERAMGFCLFNNLAIAAGDALSRGLERVLVVDYDAHHGNGTQAIFMDDERLAYLSTHQEGTYPGSGSLQDAPHARGRIVNVPLPAYAGDACFEQIRQQIIRPLIESYRPQMLFVSAGFDSHWSDPLTTLGLSTAGFYALSKFLVELAEEHCGGKIVFVLEGGYDPQIVANGVGAVFAALTGQGWSDPGDKLPREEPDMLPRVEAIRKFHAFQ
jgi:acetoin utilization deacetylase AcuC-like enzyme